jgi:ElaB/YqjD/DUF883 family membrane-anchored ribosome-binding protein
MQEVQEDDCLGWAAQLAYYLLCAVFPFVLFLTALLGFLPIPTLMERLLASLTMVLPGEAVTLLQDHMRQLVIEQKGGLLSVGILTALWSSSSAVVAITAALNQAYDVEEGRPWWKVRGIAGHHAGDEPRARARQESRGSSPQAHTTLPRAETCTRTSLAPPSPVLGHHDACRRVTRTVLTLRVRVALASRVIAQRHPETRHIAYHWNTSCSFPQQEAHIRPRRNAIPHATQQGAKTMAEQSPPGSERTSPAQERGSQEHDTTQEVRTHITETAQQMGEAASQYYAQGRQQLEGWEQSLEENIRAKPLHSVLLATGIGLLLGLLWRQ